MKFTKTEKQRIIASVQFTKNQIEYWLVKELFPLKDIDIMLQKCSDLEILLDKLYKW